MLTARRVPVFTTVLLLVISFNLSAADSQDTISKLTNMLQDDTHVPRWNEFVDRLYTLHQELIKDRDVYKKESIGGYGGTTNDAEFYREVIYYDEGTEKLLSNIKWENRNPNNIHAIDINIYDKKGRIVRDYSAYYLPKHRNAPYMTLINIHHYNNKLHSIRQFDANNDILFEFCEGTHNGEPVKISNEYYEIPERIADIEEKTQRETYKACFEQQNKSAGAFINPLNEIQLL